MRVIRPLLVVLLATLSSLSAQPRISEDRDLKEFDLTGWDCADRPGGSAKTPDGVERNKGKSRPYLAPPVGVRVLDTAGFLQKLAAFDNETRGRRRKDLTPAQREKLKALEKEVVALEGYLVIAYAGPPESTNCGSVDFHDWHLELFEKPADHAPRIGDPTPIICEITPRTQNALFRDGVRLQALAGFLRAPDLSIEPTGHPARRIRVTGYLLWDDDHNGAADIGQTVRVMSANGYHQPWRSTAWELHPILKIEPLDGPRLAPTTSEPAVASTAPPAAPTTPPEEEPAATPEPPASSPSPSVSSLPAIVTVMRPIKVKIAYGETVIPAGTQVRVLKQNTASTLTVDYLGRPQIIPSTSTNLPPKGE